MLQDLSAGHIHHQKGLMGCLGVVAIWMGKSTDNIGEKTVSVRRGKVVNEVNLMNYFDIEEKAGLLDDNDSIVMAFERDDPFTMDDRCFLNIKTMETEWAGSNIGVDEDYFIEHQDWIEVPGTPHSEWHDVFLKYLSKIDRLSDYRSSIGKTLKEITEEQCYGWFSFKKFHAKKKAAYWLDLIQE